MKIGIVSNIYQFETPFIWKAWFLKDYLIRFLEVILGALIAAPIKLLPVMYIPLQITKRKTKLKQNLNKIINPKKYQKKSRKGKYQAAPRTDTPMEMAIPMAAKE